MATQAERDSQAVVAAVVEVRLAVRRLEPLIVHNPRAKVVAQEIDRKSLRALDTACRRWFPGDTLSDLEAPPAA